MRFKIFSFENGAKIPGKFAFCIPADEGHITLGENLNPHLGWDNIPKGTKSLAIICYDPDVPSVADDVNQEGKTISKDLPRVDFFHWILVDIPASNIEIPEGAVADGITTRGKEPGKTKYGICGINNYTNWFAGDKDMAGNYGGYDGPCPPWNDEIIHHYVFTIYALEVETLGLEGIFGGPEVLKVMEDHILEKAEWVGTYTLNPKLR